MYKTSPFRFHILIVLSQEAVANLLATVEYASPTHYYILLVFLPLINLSWLGTGAFVDGTEHTRLALNNLQDKSSEAEAIYLPSPEKVHRFTK